MTDSDEVKLLPCACGESAFVAMVNDARQVWCRRDMCWKGPLRSTKAEAIAAWNNSTIPTRPPVVTDEVVERVAAALEATYAADAKRFHGAIKWKAYARAAIASMPAVVSGGQT